MARASYSDETRGAVLSALVAGQSIPEASARFDVPEGTIKAWASRQQQRGSLPVATVATGRQAELGELLSDYLAELLATLSAQARVIRDTDWLKGQKAAEIAALHSTLADAAIRLLSALEPADDPAELS